MKLYMVSAILLFSFSQQALAVYPRPDHCPTVAALQSVGVSYMEKQTDSWYGVVDSNFYETKDKWAFGVGNFKTDDENLAKQQAIAVLGRLKLVRGPSPIQSPEAWMCSYSDPDGHWAVAITPTMDNVSLYKFV